MTQENRIERDSLGEVEVPAEVYWGAQTQRAIDNFPVSGHLPAFGFIWAGAAIKRAAAQVHRDLGLLPAKHAEAMIAAACVCAGEYLSPHSSRHRAHMETVYAYPSTRLRQRSRRSRLTGGPLRIMFLTIWLNQPVG